MVKTLIGSGFLLDRYRERWGVGERRGELETMRKRGRTAIEMGNPTGIDNVQ